MIIGRKDETSRSLLGVNQILPARTKIQQNYYILVLNTVSLLVPGGHYRAEGDGVVCAAGGAGECGGGVVVGVAVGARARRLEELGVR